VSEQKVED